MRRKGRWHWLGGILLCCLLVPLQGCATYAVWGRSFVDGEVLDPDAAQRAREPQFTRELVQRTQTSGDVVLHGDRELPEAGLWIVDGDGARWWLRPGLGAGMALQLLADAEFGQVAGAALVSEREVVDDEVAAADVSLTLSFTIDPKAVGAVVDPATLRPEALRVLATPRSNAYVFAADPTLYLPVVLRQCVQRATAVDLTRLCEGAPTAARIEAFTFVDADGRPCYEPGAPMPAGSDDPELPLADRLRLLRAASLLVRVSTPTGEQVLWLRPERLWQWSTLDVAAGVPRHVSRWVLEPVRAARYARPEQPTLRLPAHGEFAETTFKLVPVPFPRREPQKFWERLAVTPITLALDCTLFLPVNLFWLWANGEVASSRQGRRDPGR